MKRFLFFAIASLLFVACDNKFEDVGNTIQGVSTLPTLTAEFAEDATRTYVEDNTYLRWHEGDLLTAFYGNTLNRKYKFNGKTGDNSGSFKHIPSGDLDTGNAFDRIYAIYPYQASASITDNGVISYSLPAEQEYAEKSFGKDANTMIAVTENLEDTFLGFKNVCGYLKIKLYGEGTVKSIELRGNNGEKIAGKATITATYGTVPEAVMSEDATESITLNCGEGITLSADAEKATEFWFVVPPTTFSKGITITATDMYGSVFEQSTSNKVVVSRNEIQPMASIEAILREPKCPNNEIWYTSSDGKITIPLQTNSFGANIVSNTYENGKGVITFDGNVTMIGDITFYNNCNLTSITIPDSVTTFGNAIFVRCIELKEFNSKYASSDGRCLIIDGVLNSFAPAGLTEYIIPDSVTAIGDYAFEYCTSLTRVTIPDSVTTIGDYTFYSCSHLTSVTTGDSVTTIGKWAFSDCTSLTSVTIGDSVTTIGDGAFCGCNSLTEFKGKFASDGGRCLIIDGVLNSFAIGCGATEYTIPDSVTTIGERAFCGCNSLTSVTIGDSVTTIGECAFSGCYSLTSVIIPDSVTTIGNSAFYSCESLTSVTIPDSVTTIGESAFASCTSLTSVYSKPTTPPSLGDNAFIDYDYSNDSYIYIGCPIYVPRGCGEVYKSADGWREYADYIVEFDYETGEVVPEGQPKNEIWYTTSDGNIQKPYKTNAFGANVVSNTYEDGQGIITFDDNVTMIGDDAFDGCGRLASITIPNSVTMIGEEAFANCSKLTSIEISDSVTTIGEYAFSRCTSLASITIPYGVTNIEYGAFFYCRGLGKVYCKPTTPPSLGSAAFQYDYWDYVHTYFVNIGCTIYVPRGCGEAYKSAYKWSDYAEDIVEYDF